MHRLKTGALLEGSVMMGATCAGAQPVPRAALQNYGAAVGLAFQVVDDILDVTADSVTLGKTAGKDEQNNKPTYVSLMGVDGARELLESLRQEARTALLSLGNAGHRLAEIADYIVGRDH